MKRIRGLWKWMVLVGLLGSLASCGQPEGAPMGPTGTPVPPSRLPSPPASPTSTPAPTLPSTPIAPCATAPMGRLAFLRDGAVGWKDLPGGEERWRTPAEGYTRLALSPDGAWVLAWKGESAAVVLEMTGTATLSLPEGIQAAVWAPSGATLAYADAQGIWILEPASGSQRPMWTWEKGMHLDPGAPVGLAWSPDGTRLAFSYERIGSSPGQIVEQGLAWVDRSGNLRRVWSFPNGAQEQAWLAGWSGDGRWLLFWHGLHRSMSLAADGLELLAISATGGTSPQEVANPVLPWPGEEISPLGNSIPAAQVPILPVRRMKPCDPFDLRIRPNSHRRCAPGSKSSRIFYRPMGLNSPCFLDPSPGGSNGHGATSTSEFTPPPPSHRWSSES